MASTPRNKPLRAAVVGAGRIAQQHLRAMTEWKLADVVGICDLSPSMAACAAERFEIPQHFTDFESMLVDLRPDVVHITTPPAAHYPLARLALERGAHVIVEKPATVHLHELETLVDRADEKQLYFIEDYNYLFSNTLQQLLSLRDEGLLGEIIHVEAHICLNLLGTGGAFVDTNAPHWCHRFPGSLVADFATHLAYLAHAFVGPMRNVQTLYSKRCENSPLPVDEFRAQVDAQLGTASFFLSCRAQPDCFFVRVSGTRGSAQAHLFEPRFTCELVYDGPKPLLPLRNCLNVGGQSLRDGFRSITSKLSGGPGGYGGLWELMRRTYQSLSQGGLPPVSHQQVREVNRWVHAMLEQGPVASSIP
jgi:predicted dehydrogenase